MFDGEAFFWNNFALTCVKEFHLAIANDDWCDVKHINGQKKQIISQRKLPKKDVYVRHINCQKEQIISRRKLEKKDVKVICSFIIRLCDS